MAAYKRALRAHRRSIDQRNIRDQQLMGRRKIDDMSPLKEVDLNVSQDHQEQAPPVALPKPGAVKPDRREMLLKWKQEKELKQKLAAREKAKNRTFKVCHVKYDPTPTWSAAEEDNKKAKPKQPAGPMRASARLAARTETKPKPDAPVGRVTRSRAASANQKAAAEPPKRTTRQRVPSGTSVGKKEVPARQTRKRATSTKETEPKPVSQLIQALTHTPGNKQSPVAMETMNNTPAGLRRSGRLTPQPMAALIPEDTPVAMGTTELAVVGTPVKLHSPIGEGSEFTEDGVTEEFLEDGTVAITTEMVVVGTPVKLHSPIGEGSEFREDGVTEEFLEDGTVAITTEIPEQGEERKQSFSMFLMPTSSVAETKMKSVLRQNRDVTLCTP